MGRHSRPLGSFTTINLDVTPGSGPDVKLVMTHLGGAGRRPRAFGPRFDSSCFGWQQESASQVVGLAWRN